MNQAFIGGTSGVTVGSNNLTGGPATPLSVQAKVDQIRGAVAEAHSYLDIVAPVNTADGNNIPAAGLHSDLDRLLSSALDLNTRLRGLFG